MSPHDDERPDQAKADELERELDDLEEQKDRLGAEIDSTAEDWKRRQHDDRVPGASGEEDDEDAGDDEDGG